MGITLMEMCVLPSHLITAENRLLQFAWHISFVCVELDLSHDHVTCVIIAIGRSATNPESHNFNSLQHSNLQ